MDLLNIAPNKVSRDLSGYITFIMGTPKTGKTTMAAQMPDALILASEPGYHALPGVVAQDITSWSEMKQAFRELKKPEVKAHFKCIVVDTVDNMADFCQKYICNQNGIQALGDLGYGKGWTAFKDEFKDVFRGLAQLGYAVYFIGHVKEQMVAQPDGTEKMIVRSAMSASTRAEIENIADIIGYAHQKEAGKMSVLTLRSPDGSITCGSRFKYMPEEIPFSYDNLVKALNDAIDKESAEHAGAFVTDERPAPVAEKIYDFDKMMATFQEMVGKLMSENQSNSLKITAIVEQYLGKGRKVGDCTPQQCEQLDLILQDMSELLK